MAKNNLAARLHGHKALWLEIERNTADLLRAILSSRKPATLSGDDLWNLLRLTWVTLSRGKTSPKHWKRLKIPALAALWPQAIPPIKSMRSLPASLNAMSLPDKVRETASKPTGMVNFRNVWRNSSKKWCHANRNQIVVLIQRALQLKPNDQTRLNLAWQIEKLPAVPPPTASGKYANSAILITPLVACLDPSKRFPVINGRMGVIRLLSSLYLANETLGHQAEGMINLIGQFGISDSFMLDVLADDLAHIPRMVPRRQVRQRRIVRSGEVHGARPLPILDEDERKAVQKAATVTFRNRHRRMTNAVATLFQKYELLEGTGTDARYDVVIKNYDGKNRDLLLEAKPDPDKGSIRIAIGQLYDYRRFLKHRAGTDLAILTISRPQESHRELLFDLQITALWFVDERCRRLSGEGKVWEAVEKELLSRAAI